MEFNIGDQVRTTATYEYGIVAEKFRSQSGQFAYLVDLDSGTKMLYSEGELELYKKALEYTYEIERVENVVIARLYEVENDIKTELAVEHGHIFHEGALGVAQAASYALKKIYDKIGGGY